MDGNVTDRMYLLNIRYHSARINMGAPGLAVMVTCNGLHENVFSLR